MLMAIALTEGFLLKLMVFDESRLFMEAKCKWFLFEVSAIEMSHGIAEVPVLMRSSTLHMQVLRLLAWKGTLTSSDCLVYWKEVNYLTHLDCFFPSLSSLAQICQSVLVEASHSALSEIPAWHLKLLIVWQQTTVVFCHFRWKGTTCIKCSIWYFFSCYLPNSKV